MLAFLGFKYLKLNSNNNMNGYEKSNKSNLFMYTIYCVLITNYCFMIVNTNM